MSSSIQELTYPQSTDSYHPSPSVIFNSQSGIPPAHPSATNPTNPVVFFDISIASHTSGRIIIELFADIVPRTAENFRQLCTGEYRVNGLPVGYKGCVFHQVVKDFMCASGDVMNNDGSGSISIYGAQFEDENFILKHDRPGRLSMANNGINTNGSQFFILTNQANWLDDKHVVFGQVIDGMLTVRKIENVGVGINNRPKLPVVITQCGEL